jgi:Fur family transcriptional regulator, ferric uptake regulator
MTRPTQMTKQRSTRQRVAIKDALNDAGGFRSAQELHEQLRAGGDRVGLTTVYRTLQTLSDAGEIDVVRREDGESVYRRCLTGGHHHHLVCRSCGYSVEIDNEDVERWADAAARTHGFIDVTHDLELFGVCRTCASR